MFIAKNLTTFNALIISKAYLSDLDLNRSVVLGSDEPVGGRALSWDIDVHNVSLVVLHFLKFMFLS